jgi:hypothetical protein
MAKSNSSRPLKFPKIAKQPLIYSFGKKGTIPDTAYLVELQKLLRGSSNSASQPGTTQFPLAKSRVTCILERHWREGKFAQPSPIDHLALAKLVNIVAPQKFI